jgi:hypothetical protein
MFDEQLYPDTIAPILVSQVFPQSSIVIERKNIPTSFNPSKGIRLLAKRWERKSES